MLDLKKGQRSVEVLALVGYCGEFPVAQLKNLEGYYDYNRRLVTQLVREGYLRERTFKAYGRHVVRSLSLTEKGLLALSKQEPDDAFRIAFQYFAPENGQGDWKKTLRLHRGAACLLEAIRLGAMWKPSPKKRMEVGRKLTYFSTYEWNKFYEKDNKGSRASGILIRGKELYAFYYLGSHNLFWSEASEEMFREQVLDSPIGQGRNFRGCLFLVDQWDMAENLVTHGSKARTRMFRITGGMPYYCIPNTAEGKRLVEIVTDENTRGRLLRELYDFGVPHPEASPECLFDLQGLAEFYCPPKKEWSYTRPEVGYVFPFQMETMRKISNMDAKLIELPLKMLYEN